MICVEFKKQILTINEALDNLSEMSESIGPEHLDEVNAMLSKAIEDEKEEEKNKELVQWLLEDVEVED